MDAAVYLHRAIDLAQAHKLPNAEIALTGANLEDRNLVALAAYKFARQAGERVSLSGAFPLEKSPLSSPLLHRAVTAAEEIRIDSHYLSLRPYRSAAQLLRFAISSVQKQKVADAEGFVEKAMLENAAFVQRIFSQMGREAFLSDSEREFSFQSRLDLITHEERIKLNHPYFNISTFYTDVRAEGFLTKALSFLQKKRLKEAEEEVEKAIANDARLVEKIFFKLEECAHSVMPGCSLFLSPSEETISFKRRLSIIDDVTYPNRSRMSKLLPVLIVVAVFALSCMKASMDRQGL